MVTLPEHYTKHSFVSERHKLIYVATPKVGCTTIKWWFANLVGVTQSILNDMRSQESDIDLKIHDIFPIAAPDIANLSDSSLSGFFEKSEYFSFALVRNPYSRIFSAWQSKLLLREPLQYESYKDLDFLDVPLVTREDIAKAFELFLEHLNATEAPSFRDIHWSSQFSHLRPDLLPNLHISHLENTEQLRDRLRNHLNTDYIDPLSSRPRNDSLIPYSRSLLTEKAVLLIRTLYKDDFEQFRYDETPPAVSAEISNDQLSTAIKAINMLRSRNRRIAEIQSYFTDSIAERDSQIAGLYQVAAEKDSQIIVLDKAVAQRDFAISNLRQIEFERDSLIEALQDIRNSRSWKVTGLARSSKTFILKTEKVLRETRSHTRKKVGRLSLSFISVSIERAIRLVPGVQGRIYSMLRGAYRYLPVRTERKQRWAERVIGGSSVMRRLAINAQGMKKAWSAPAELDLFLKRIAANRAVGLRRAMVIEHRIPTPDKTSSSVRLAAMCKLIREEGWGIVFISDVERSSYHWVLEDTERDLPKYENALSAIDISCFYGIDTARYILENAGSSFDLVILCYPEIMHKYAPIVRAFAPLARLAYDTVDLHGLRFAREAEIKKDPDIVEKANYYEKIERAGFSVADIVIAITPDESRQIIARCETAEPIIVPNIHSLGDAGNLYEERRGLLFIGHYLHTPNEDAVCHFVRDIYPLIEKHAGDIEFTIIGSSITEKVRQLAQTSVYPVGYVEDPIPYFDRARVFVAPLRYGAGMKGKIGQALSLGLPIVTTSIGAEGMELENERNVLIADDPCAFAAAVLRLYHDRELWNRLSAAGREHILTNFSESTAKPAIVSMLKRATETSTKCIT